MRKLAGFFRHGILSPQFGVGALLTALALLVQHLGGPGPIKNLWLGTGCFFIAWSFMRGYLGFLDPEAYNVEMSLRRRKMPDGNLRYELDWGYGREPVPVPAPAVLTKRWLGIGAALLLTTTCITSCQAFLNWEDLNESTAYGAPPYTPPFFVPLSDVLKDARQCTILHEPTVVPGSGQAFTLVETTSSDGDRLHIGLFIPEGKRVKRGEKYRCQYVEHFDYREMIGDEPPYRSINKAQTILLDERPQGEVSH